MESLRTLFKNRTDQRVDITFVDAANTNLAAAFSFAPGEQRPFPRPSPGNLFNMTVLSNGKSLGVFCVGNGSINFYKDTDGSYKATDWIDGPGISYGPHLCGLSSSAPSTSSSSQTGKSQSSQFHLSASMGLILLLILLAIFLAFKTRR